jgi:hypothetical protein
LDQSLLDALRPHDTEASASDDSDVEDVELVDDESDTLDADEEMSGGLEDDESDDDDDEDDALDDDDEDETEDDADDEEDAAKAEILRQKTELEQKLRQIEYEKQQQANQAHWDSIQAEAEYAFEWEWDQIQSEKHNHLDPDAYERQQVGQWKTRVKEWYRRFEASITEARRAQMERAAIPSYAARVAQHFSLTDDQAKDLLEYPVDRMPREAEKMARTNQREADLRKKLQQERRSKARDGQITKGGNTTGGGRAPAKRVVRGSDEHLARLLAGAL